MQSHNEPGSERSADVVGNRSSNLKAERTPLHYADARRASEARDIGRGLTPERETRIRRRVSDGSYDTSSFADTLARRIIRSGDL
jgi:hypothetical protein